MSAKKVTPKATENTKSENLGIIMDMPVDQREELLEFALDFMKMPQAFKDNVSLIVGMASMLPDSKKEGFLKELGIMDSPLAEEDEGDSISVGDEDPEDPMEDYPHFLPRPNVQKYTLRVTLRGIKPAIYRKFNVPSNITLRHLSELTLDLMGWHDVHLNHFRKGDDYYAPGYQREHEISSPFSACRNHNQEDYTLSDILSVKGKTIEWEYDFGDSWCHDVKLSAIGDYKEDEPLVSFVKGERACPPEDCGGIWGYEDLLAIYQRKKSGKRITKDEKEQLEWYMMDDDFDPDHFSASHARLILEDYCE